MSLFDKLKPKTRAPGIGKIADCPKCGYANAEHYSANYIQCPRCDAPKAKAPTIETRRYAAPADEYIDLERDEDTNPGGWASSWHKGPPLPLAAPPQLYVCRRCNTGSHYSPTAVANGQTCDQPDASQFGGRCGGLLRAYP